MRERRGVRRLCKAAQIQLLLHRAAQHCLGNPYSCGDLECE